MAKSYDRQARKQQRGKGPGTATGPGSAPSSGEPVQADRGHDSAGPYRTLFVGTLVQESALTVGGSEGIGSVDDPLCRDGAGQLTLRGSGLAGALVATARRLYRADDLAAISLAPGSAPDEAALPDSLWRVFTSHPHKPTPRPELRPGVGIRQDTGAAREGALFDSEILPRGTEWPFLLEVKTGKASGPQAEGIALAALREWEQGYCWAGANIARGLGWMRLTSLRIYRMKKVPAQVDYWPDSSRPLSQTLDGLSKVVPPFSSDAAAQHGILDPERTAEWYYQNLEGWVQVGQAEDDGYGLDGLAVGGHGTAVLALPWDGEHMLWPEGAQSPKNSEAFDPDFAVALTRTRTGTGDWAPLIPGSSLRGPLRHVLSRHLRIAGKTIRDPLVQPRRTADEPADPVEDLFGSLDQDAALLVRDAHVEGEWCGAWLQQHAEDEFAAGVFGSAKFDRMAVLRGSFKWRLVVQAASKDELKHRVAWLQKALNYATQGFMGLGSQQWRGLGWCRWKITGDVARRAGD